MNNIIKKFKLKIKTDNARKWKHLLGGNIRTLEEVNAINNSNKNKAKGLFKGMISGNILPTMENIGNMIGSAYNGWISPLTTYITGEPSVLPGRVNMSLYKNAKGILKGPLTDEGFVNFVERLSKGRIKPEFVTKNGKVSPANYNYVDLKSETVPKGFVKGNEVTPDLRHSISEEGLTSRIAKPFIYENPITNEAEAAAAKDWLEMMKPKRGPVGPLPKQPTVKKIDTDYTLSGTSQERFIDNKYYGISKRGRVSTADKNSRAMESSDARILNSGFTNLRKGLLLQVEKNLHLYPMFERKIFEKKLLNLHRRGRPAAEIKKFKNDFYRELASKYGYYKLGGVMKALEGSKFGLFLNSDLGKGLTNLVILGGTELWKSGLANSFNKNFDKATDSLAELMKKKSWGEKYNEALKFAPLYFQLNALDGVHYGIIDYQEFAKSYADSNVDLDSIEQFKYERELLKQNLLNAILGNSSVSDILLQGLGLVGNYLSNKSTKESTTNMGTTNVKINSLGNDFSSGYNLFTKNSALYNSDKFWNLK